MEDNGGVSDVGAGENKGTRLCCPESDRVTAGSGFA